MLFEDVLEIKNGRNQRAVENPNGVYPIYGSGGIMGYADDFICQAQTVVIGRKGNINKPLFVEVPFWNVDTAFGLEAKRSVLLPKYLYYFCVRYDFEKLNKTVTIPSLTKADLLKIKIELPKLSEQEDIVSRLESIERVMAIRHHQLFVLDSLIKARFVEMFGDPVSNNMGWPIKPLLDMGDCKNGMNFHYDDSGIDLHCLGVGDFQNHSVISDTSVLPMISLNEKPSDEYLLKDDDIVFVRSNGNKALVGRCVAVYPGDIPTTFSGFCIRYRKKDGIAIGWCNANDRANYYRVGEFDLDNVSEDRTFDRRRFGQCKSIVCFEISPGYRGKGIATQLLKRVCIDAEAEGYDCVEAYPVEGAQSSLAFTGPVALYQKMGFSEHSRIGNTIIMRKSVK